MRAPIGFTGPAGVGKSTAANIVGGTRISFAQPLRDMLKAFGLTDEQMSVTKAQPIHWLGGVTPRYMMQTLGTEWGRERIDPDIWVKVAKNRALVLMATGHDVTFDDVRFDNEAAMIHDLGGTVVRLHGDALPAMVHASEAGVSDRLVDHFIHNSRDSIFEQQLHWLFAMAPERAA